VGACVAVFALVLAVLVATPAQASPPAAAPQLATVPNGVARTANLSAFDPGNIISDAVFFKSDTMTEAQIQAFLTAKVPKCASGYTCLKSYSMASRSIPADPMCSAYAGASSERAARIIYKVARACGINPQVILVMLQKEQSLVTDTTPSSGQYRAAMGQGCPDTAACDTKYYGFFNQVYWGAWQLKRYANPPGTSKYFTWYAPGKTWNVKYHPKSSCGTKPVTIRNQATANLYYYTPYTPNAAALRAGYGTGDSCSSYGNRNFFSYFTDWFGSTQAVDAVLYKVGTAIWVKAGTTRYHVTAEAYPEYKRVLGDPVTVDAAYLDGFTDKGDASFYVKNASTGVVAYLQDGKTHRFPTCELVATWGGACASGLVTLPDADFKRFGAGPEMTSFARTAATSRIHRIDGKTLQPVFDAATAGRINGGSVPYAAVLRSSVAAGFTVASRVMFAPGDFVLTQGSSDVYLPTSTGALIHLPSWAIATQLGLSATVASRPTNADVAGYTKSGKLSHVVSCGGTVYYAAQGTLSRLTAGAPNGLTVTKLDDALCARLNLKGATVSRDVFLVQTGTTPVYHVVNGVRRWVTSGVQLNELNGGSAPTILRVDAAGLALIPAGQPYPAPGSLVRADNASEVWLVDGTKLLHLPSWGLASSWGLPTSSPVVPAARLKDLATGGDLTHFARCSGTLYAGGGGILSRVASGDSGGNVVTTLGASTCAALRLSGSAYTGAVFLSDGKRTVVAAGGGFVRLKDAAAAARANGGTKPSTRAITAAYLDQLPKPTSLPASGDVVRASSSSTVSVVDGEKRFRLPNWGVAADLGIIDRYRTVPTAEIGNLPETGTDMTLFVTCGGRTYVGASGVLSSVASAGVAGFRTTELTSATCATLTLTGPAIGNRLFVKAAGVDTVYVTENGKLRALRSGESPTTVNGGTAPTVLVLDARTIAGMPRV